MKIKIIRFKHQKLNLNHLGSHYIIHTIIQDPKMPKRVPCSVLSPHQQLNNSSKWNGLAQYFNTFTTIHAFHISSNKYVMCKKNNNHCSNISIKQNSQLKITQMQWPWSNLDTCIILIDSSYRQILPKTNILKIRNFPHVCIQNVHHICA